MDSRDVLRSLSDEELEELYRKKQWDGVELRCDMLSLPQGNAKDLAGVLWLLNDQHVQRIEGEFCRRKRRVARKRILGFIIRWFSSLK